jgi:multidrug efflux pump subunit AcrA (membrane-fusion protein)
MTTLTRIRGGRLVVVAPCEGVVVFSPPPSPAGELEVFARGDVLATVAGVLVEAPGDGFVLALHVEDGTTVRTGARLLTFREV